MDKIIFLLLALAFAVHAQQISVAVLPSESMDAALSNTEENALTDKMREAALNVLPASTFTLLNQDAVVKRLGGAESYIKECRESSCIVDLGKKAQVDYVAKAVVRKLGGKFMLNVELYRVSTSGLMGVYNGYADNIYGLIDLIEKNVPEAVFRKIHGVSRAETSKIETSSDTQSRSSNILTDARDGKKYKVVKIGSQTWMAENLNYNASGSKCYDNKTDNCVKYGRLYNWQTANTACPKGWHLPSKAEWEKLTSAVGGEKTEGLKLKAKSGWNSYQGKYGNGTDDFGFSALPGGYGSSGGSFSGVGDTGHWWSSTEFDSLLAYYRNIYYSDEFAHWSSRNKPNLFSVRCVQD